MKRAFTMIELVFVIVILGILASMVIPKMAATRDDAEVVSGLQRINTAVAEIVTYYTAHGRFDDNLSKMTGEVLVDSAKNIFVGNFNTTPAYFANLARSKICLKLTASDSNGTLTVEDVRDGSSYCNALIDMMDTTLGVHKIGGSSIYN